MGVFRANLDPLSSSLEQLGQPAGHSVQTTFRGSSIRNQDDRPLGYVRLR